MELRQGYKQTDLGVIPNDWEIKTTIQIAQNNKQSIKIGPFGSALKKELLVENGYKVYGQENIFEGNIEIGDRFINSEHYKKLKTCELLPGDFVVSMMGTVGHCMIMPEKMQAGIMDSHLLRVKIDTSIISLHYFKHVFSSSLTIIQIRMLSVGGIMEGLSSKIIKQLQFNIPPLPEQTAIANALSDMDALISQTEKLIEKKKAIKQGAMQELLKPKEGWVTKSFSEIFVKYPSKNYQINSSNYKDSGLFPVIDQGKSKIVAYSDDASKLFNCPQQGIIVFGDHTRIFKYINFDFLIGADGTQLLTTKDGYNTLFLYYILINREIPNTGYNRHFKFLKEMMFKLPISLESQTSISGKLMDMDSEILILESKSKKLKQQKQGMMQTLLTGKIRLI